jgi:hypothetical protein
MSLPTIRVNVRKYCKIVLIYLSFYVQFVTYLIEGNAMPIDSSTEHGVFEPEATAAMGEAFDAACVELHCTSQPDVVRELIATLVIAAASQGELDPIRLRMVALAGFAVCRPRRLDACAIARIASAAS